RRRVALGAGHGGLLQAVHDRENPLLRFVEAGRGPRLGRGRAAGHVVMTAPVPPFLAADCRGRPVCRLGLAGRGGGGLTPEDVGYAVAHGVNFLNWCGVPDGLSRAVAEMGPRRRDVLVCVQFEARSARDAAAELMSILGELRTDYVD